MVVKKCLNLVNVVKECPLYVHFGMYGLLFIHLNSRGHGTIFFSFILAWAFLSGIHGEEMLKPEDAYAFRNTMLICIGVGFVASIGKVF